ncbi:MAG: hypothetical protein JSR59_25545 [Proteobacteria bacterium]|nr:hypothetical protein [Pseudomonadota bacterium]
MKKVLWTCGLLALLAGCGGGGSDPPVEIPPAPPATAAVPPSASQSVTGFVGYLVQLVAASADNLQPVDVNQVTPPVSDSAEPSPVN